MKKRSDYQKPTYELKKTELTFHLDENETIVESSLSFHQKEIAPILLNGNELKLLSMEIDGFPFKDYQETDEGLIIKTDKTDFTLKIRNTNSPIRNTQLMGLYASNGLLCTQCEPEGFRRITYYPDHPDIMSLFTVTVHADRKKYPVVLSNGNCIKDDGDTLIYEDPFKKPSYLFALVAGDLASVKDTFTTCSGRKVGLSIYCEQGKEKRLLWAMDSLKRAMKYDEEAFGREYDLDIFNIVAVRDFNAGAMENKSLNIFNDQCLLADEKTASDSNYESIEGVVAHEYFHNWSGDRVTARDWFNLSLKEGFTVFRDQSFSGHERSDAVKRMDDVALLKTYQFPEDDGPLKHPVRPDAFETIDNFYTSTVYEKGAELIRMQRNILGADTFRKACDLYFSRHDGEAVTIDDFVKCMEDASGKDLSQFMHWYSVAGRPTVTAKTYFENGDMKLELKQEINGFDGAFLIPLETGIIDEKGKEIHTQTLLFNTKEQTFTFKNIPEGSVISLNRHFTAPVTLKTSLNDLEKIHLMRFDTDLFNRYDIGQEYATDVILRHLYDEKVPEDFLEAFGTSLYLNDKAFAARALVLPSSDVIGNRMDIFDVDAVLSTRKRFKKAFAVRFKERLTEIYKELDKTVPFSPAPEEAARRALRNTVLAYLAELPETQSLVFEAFKKANNMTDEIGSLSILVGTPLKEAEEALEIFTNKWKNDHLVLNKAFAMLASLNENTVTDKVIQMMKNPLFSIKNPNNVRSVIGVFSHNLKAFHKKDGSGYKLLSDTVAQLDNINPHMAERIIHPLCRWKHFDEERATLMKKELQKLMKKENLSVNLKETLERSL
ncbi:MAG: aminopeptidase N [Alphaproteobacteria bacterium]|nr:aminopeptidase N [Alphaproteobacteria bacterium]